MSEEDEVVERVQEIVEEEFFELEDIVERVVRQKKEELIEEKVKEEIAKILIENPGNDTGKFAS